MIIPNIAQLYTVSYSQEHVVATTTYTTPEQYFRYDSKKRQDSEDTQNDSIFADDESDDEL